MDELRRAAFMAKNAGSSVRIVLPFNKMAKVNKTAAFGFAEYIRIQLMDAVEMEEYRDEVNIYTLAVSFVQIKGFLLAHTCLMILRSITLRFSRISMLLIGRLNDFGIAIDNNRVSSV